MKSNNKRTSYLQEVPYSSTPTSQPINVQLNIKNDYQIHDFQSQLD